MLGGSDKPRFQAAAYENSCYDIMYLYCISYLRIDVADFPKKHKARKSQTYSRMLKSARVILVVYALTLEPVIFVCLFWMHVAMPLKLSIPMIKPPPRILAIPM